MGPLNASVVFWLSIRGDYTALRGDDDDGSFDVSLLLKE